jgi:hypothetical protein
VEQREAGYADDPGVQGKMTGAQAIAASVALAVWEAIFNR